MKTFFLAFVLAASSVSLIYGNQSPVVENYFKVILSATTVKQGGTLTVFVDSANKLTHIELEAFGRAQPVYHVWHEVHEHFFRVFLGIPIFLKAGKHRILIRGIDVFGQKLEIYADVQVKDVRFPVQNIRLSGKKRSLLNEAILQEEVEIIRNKLKLKDKKVYFVSDFLMPVRGRISSSFGVGRRYGSGKISSYHKGVDIVGSRGTAVRAANGGRVMLSAKMKSHGNTILINHGHGIHTIYCHLDKVLVRKGTWIKRGKIIGRVGSTGISSGPHLHFGISVNEVRVDPQDWVKGNVRFFFKQ